MHSMEFKNFQMQFLYSLLDIPLHGTECRARNRFVRIISERAGEIEKERIALNEKYADKKKPKLDNGNYNITPAKLEKFKKEYEDLMNEKFVIDILPSNKDDIGLVKNLIFNSQKGLNIFEGQMYEQICQAFETQQPNNGMGQKSKKQGTA